MKRLAGVALMALMGLGLGATTASAQSRIVFTIDVESQVRPLTAQIDARCAGGRACGVMEMARIFDAHSIPATFFLSVFEYRTWGDAVMRDLAQRLVAAHQDVELHTHPQFAFDPRRNELHQYDAAAQANIIREGAARLAGWTGRPVMAHRAGDYSADANTLRALRQAGIGLDSSLLWGHPSCRLTGLGLPRNLPSRWDGILEVPVTVLRQLEYPDWFGDSLAPVSALRKIDVNWLTGPQEARAALDAAVQARVPIVVVFLHSFSLMLATPSSGEPVEDAVARANLEALLDHAKELGVPAVSMAQLASESTGEGHAAATDPLPVVRIDSSLPRYLWHRGKAARGGGLQATEADAASATMP